MKIINLRSDQFERLEGKLGRSKRLQEGGRQQREASLFVGQLKSSHVDVGNDVVVIRHRLLFLNYLHLHIFGQVHHHIIHCKVLLIPLHRHSIVILRITGDEFVIGCAGLGWCGGKAKTNLPICKALKLNKFQ